MHRSRWAPGCGAVLALLLAPSLAPAEPIGWSYTVKLEGDDGGPYAHFGTATHYWYIPPTFPGEQGQEGQTDYQMIANVRASSEGHLFGSAVGLAYVDGAGLYITSLGVGDVRAYDLGDEWASGVSPTFWFRVRVTDDASAESRDLSYRASGGASGYFLTGHGATSVHIEDRTDTFTLGENRYTVRPRVRSSESAEHVELDVEVGPAAATPEPGTLALAGVGLAPLMGAFARRFRRRPATPA
jgi:hypothetical protein